MEAVGDVVMSNEALGVDACTSGEPSEAKGPGGSDGKETVETQSTTKQEGKKQARRKHKCPYPTCSSVVVHLPRHMKQMHGWNSFDASRAVGVFGLRNPRKETQTKKPSNRVACPFKGCTTIVKRIHNHLTDYHKLKRGTERYKRVLAAALPYREIEVVATESEAESTSSSEHSPVRHKEAKFTKKANTTDQGTERTKKMKRPKKVKKPPSIFKKVYSSSDDESTDDGYPEIFHNPLKKIPTTNNPGKNLANLPSTSTQSYFDEEVSIPHEDEENRESSSNVSHEEQEPESEDSSGGSSDGYEENESYVEDLDYEDLSPDLPDQDLFNKFKDWLQCPDGGRKDEHSALQCSRQVQLVVQYIDKEQPKLSNILDKKILRDRWLSKFEKERQPGTVKSYLGALKQFYLFLGFECPPKNTPVEELASLATQMTQWCKSFHKLVKDRFWEKRVDDMARLKTPEQVKEFDSSDVARTAVKTLAHYQDCQAGKFPTQTEYTIVRDYLLTTLCINNGSRSGALSNMTLGEFRQGFDQDGCYVVQVKKHKTFTCHGPVHLVLSLSLHQWMKIFIAKFRNVVASESSEDSAPVFLTWSNRKMRASQIGCQIGSCWGKVFGKEAGAGGATAFRKAAVSAVHKKDKDRREDLAGFMVHKKSTADRFYLIQEKATNAVKTSKYLTKLMHAQQCSPKKSQNENSPATQEANNESASCTSQQWTSPRRRKWVPEEETAIKDLFSANIANQNVTMNDVREISSKHPLLCKISDSKIRDKVRSYFKDVVPVLPSLPVETPHERFIRTGIETNPATAPDHRKKKSVDGSEYTPSLVPPSTCVSKKSSQKLFKDDEYAIFREMFKDLIETNKPVSRKYVTEKIEAEPRLCHLAEQYTGLQLADKVRTERRILARNSARKCKYTLYVNIPLLLLFCTLCSVIYWVGLPT